MIFVMARSKNVIQVVNVCQYNQPVPMALQKVLVVQIRRGLNARKSIMFWSVWLTRVAQYVLHTILLNVNLIIVTGASTLNLIAKTILAQQMCVPLVIIRQIVLVNVPMTLVKEMIIMIILIMESVLEVVSVILILELASPARQQYLKMIASAKTAGIVTVVTRDIVVLIMLILVFAPAVVA